MSLLSKGNDWESHPQGLWVGTLVEIKATTDTYGEKIRWFFETNSRNDDDKPRRVSMKSSYRGLGNEKAWLTRILEAFGYDVNDPYWTSFDDLDGFGFLINEGKQLGLEVKHYTKSDNTVGDNVADVMTLEALETRKAQLRASLDAGDAPRASARPNGAGPAVARPGATGGPASKPQGPAIHRAEPQSNRSAPPEDYVPADPFLDDGPSDSHMPPAAAQGY